MTKECRQKNYFIQQTASLIKDSKQSKTLCTSEGSKSGSEDDLNMMSIFASSKRQKVSHVHDNERNITDEALRCAETEVQSYLLGSNGVTHKTDIFVWWNKLKTSFPNVAALAQKWLSCLAASVASKKVFSSCGLVQTANEVVYLVKIFAIK